MTRCIHVSDTHGHFPKLHGIFDAVVHSGDFFPNFDRMETEVSKEMFWLEENIPMIKEWVRGKPLLFTLGNHDFTNPLWLEKIFNANGIKAICLHDKITTWESINFYGFPYIPPINGMFAYECSADEMADHLKDMTKTLNQTYVDVIVAHCPVAGILSQDFHQGGRCFGNTQMANALYYDIAPEMRPTTYLTGHIHSSHGITVKDGILYSNAATTQHIIEC